MSYTFVHARYVTERLPTEMQAFANQVEKQSLCVVALRGEHAVSIGSLRRNPLHPEPQHFTYLLADPMDTDSLPGLLDALLQAAGTDEDGLKIHLTTTESEAEWAESVGFIPVMRTWLGELKQRSPFPIPSRQFSRLSDADTPQARRSLAELHAEIYRRQHDWNPPAPILPEDAERLFMDTSELMPEHLWYSVDSYGHPNGVISLRSTSAPQVLELGWFGTLPGVGASVHRALFETAVAALGSRKLNLEVDDNQSQLLDYLNDLSVDWQRVLVRYQIQIPTR